MPASRRRRALLGVAASVPVVLAIQAPPAIAEPTRPFRQDTDPPEPDDPYCSTMLLTPDELAAGKRSTVDCYPTMDESLRAIGVADPANAVVRSADGDPIIDDDPTINAGNIVAIHYQPSGHALTIGGTNCNGGGISFDYGHAWNDRITSTAGRRCLSIKHWTDANFSGASQAASGSGQVSLAPGIAGQVSSMRYW